MALIGVCRFYRRTRPWRGPVCRFRPTCSQYAIEALQRYGAARGSWMAICRICRCHPFSTGGFDPVP